MLPSSCSSTQTKRTRAAAAEQGRAKGLSPQCCKSSFCPSNSAFLVLPGNSQQLGKYSLVSDRGRRRKRSLKENIEEKKLQASQQLFKQNGIKLTRLTCQHLPEEMLGWNSAWNIFISEGGMQGRNQNCFFKQMYSRKLINTSSKKPPVQPQCKGFPLSHCTR